MILPDADTLPPPDGIVVLVLPFVMSSLVIGMSVVLSSMFVRVKPMEARVRRQEVRLNDIRSRQALSSLLRIGVPTVLAAAVGFVYFDDFSLLISSMLDSQSLTVLAQDNSTGQYVQNFLVVIDLLFAILAGSAYAQLYRQQELIYFALYKEVTVAKSLLEQLTLIGQARPWYPDALQRMRVYLMADLRRIETSPIERLSARPEDDPLEAIMYLTSVGVPSVVYETVRDLRQARGERLGAFQRKFPLLGIVLLYLLAAMELAAFPLLGAGTARISETAELTTVSILELQSLLFASLCGCVMLVLRIIQELWEVSGGVFNTDDILEQMVFGLEEELDLRMAGRYDSVGERRALDANGEFL